MTTHRQRQTKAKQTIEIFLVKFQMSHIDSEMRLRPQENCNGIFTAALTDKNLASSQQFFPKILVALSFCAVVSILLSSSVVIFEVYKHGQLASLTEKVELLQLSIEQQASRNVAQQTTREKRHLKQIMVCTSICTLNSLY